MRIDDPYDDLYLKGGVCVTDHLLIGVVVRTDRDKQLFNTFNNSSTRGDLFARLYLTKRRFNPYLEISAGTFTDDGIYLSLRPSVGAELRYSPGVFGRVALAYAPSSRGDAYTLEVGHLVSLSGWSNKDRIPERMQTGNIMINGHLASLSLLQNDTSSSSTSLYGNAQLDATLAIGSKFLVGADLRYVRTTFPYKPIEKPSAYTSFTAAAEIKYRFLQIGNFIEPYGGVGVEYAHTEHQPVQDSLSTLPTIVTDSIRPYLNLGVYFHLTERITLNVATDQFLRRISAIEDRRRIEVGLAIRLNK